MELTGEMYQQVNIYNNQISVFGKNFTSPINKNCLKHYKFYLIDSLFIDNNWCYQIDFTPKREGELTFDGSLWINDTTYAIKKVKAERRQGKDGGARARDEADVPYHLIG